MAYTSGQIAQLLGVSRQTVNTWAEKFSDVLSPDLDARQRGQARFFSEDDVKVFSFAAKGRERGMTFDDIVASLAAGERGEVPEVPARVVGSQVEARFNVLRQQIEDLTHERDEAVAQANRATGAMDELRKRAESAEKKVDELNRLIGQIQARLGEE